MVPKMIMLGIRGVYFLGPRIANKANTFIIMTRREYEQI